VSWGNRGTNLAFIFTKVLDWFYSIIEIYSSILNNWVWHKLWNKDKGIVRIQ